MIKYFFRSLADGHPPKVLTRIHIDSGYPAIGRLEQRQPIRQWYSRTPEHSIIGNRGARGLFNQFVALTTGCNDPRGAVFSGGHIENTCFRICCRRTINIHPANITRTPQGRQLPHIIISMQRWLKKRTDLIRFQIFNCLGPKLI